jgi:ribosome biogenesis GTPase
VERSAAASGGREVQILASNIDMIGICMGLDRDFNIRRLERYLSIVYNSGAVPLVILTKSDLTDDLPPQETLAQQAAFGVEVIVTSSVNKTGFGQLARHLGRGRTLAFLGSSGVGKSTVINYLFGNERAAVSHVRSDGKGRHTTTSRELYLLPDGTCLIDTPGLREIQLSVESDVDTTFSDIEELAQECRFSDCTHTKEPGCAVRRAIEEGDLDPARFDNYMKMRHELSYIGLDSRRREKKKLKRMFSDVGSFKEVRDFAKKRPKREG